MEEDYKMVVKSRFERKYNMMECKSYVKNEYVPENKDIFVYGFKHVKTDKVDKYALIGCDLHELYEYDILFNFWSNIFINKQMEIRIFEIREWSLLTLVKRNNFFKNQSIVCG